MTPPRPTPGAPAGRRAAFREKVRLVWEGTTFIEQNLPASAPRLYRAMLWTLRRATSVILSARKEPAARRPHLKIV